VGPNQMEPSFFTKLSQTIFVTKQKVLETLGQAEGSSDQLTKDRIEKLNAIDFQYERLFLLSTALLSHFQALVDSQKLIGEHFNMTGMKEEEVLTDALITTGNMHQGLDRASGALIATLQRILSTVGTFKNAAIQDTMINLERYTKARQEYDGSRLRLEDINSGSRPNREKVEEAKLICEESKKLMDKYSEDLSTKVVLLNEKRVQDLSFQLAEYMKGFRTYYVACNRVVEQSDFRVNPGGTSEFRTLMGDDNGEIF